MNVEIYINVTQSIDQNVDIVDGFIRVKGSRKNKFTFLGVEAPAWQGAEAQEYRDISALWQHRQAGCIGA